jgi:hypothetical protein
MSKAKSNRKKGRVAQPAPTGRRKFLALGLGAGGALAVAGIAGYNAGWFGSSATQSTANAPTSLATGKPLPPVTLTADAANATRAADDIVGHYARELNNPSALIHAVRGFGKNFTLNDNTKAVDFLCSKFAAEREVNGKRYVYFPRAAEVHDNSFLKTMLEAGVSPEQPITAGSNKYTLRDLGEHAKSLFRCDPQNFGRFDPELLHNHLPWGLIAFSILMPPNAANWTNAYGETINLPEVINKSLAVYEGSITGVKEAIERGEDESVEFRQAISKFSCYGMHAAYSYYSCLQHDYRNDKLPERLSYLLDSLLLRMQGDAAAIDREAEAAKGMGPEWLSRIAYEGQGGKLATKGQPPSNTLEVMRMRSQIKMLGHALEAINYVQLHNLLPLTPGQKRRLQVGEQLLYDNLVRLRATNLDPFMRWYDKFITETVIAVAHAARALKLPTPANPDTIA